MSRSLMGSRGESRDQSPDDHARKISTPCVSYLALTARNTRKSSYKHYGAQKAPEPEHSVIDPSVLYRRCGRGRARSEGSHPSPASTSVSRKTSCALYFLPPNNESPVLVIRKHSSQHNRKDSFDSGIGMQDEERRKKKSQGEAPGEVGDKLQELRDLSRRLEVCGERMAELDETASKIQQTMRNSTEFQMQLLKLSDASELEKGVNTVLEMVDFDRKTELSRLRKKAEDCLKRVERGATMVGDQDELRDLMIGLKELEKKTQAGFDEVSRLEIKTERVEIRQREVEKMQRHRREKYAMSNGSMKVLLQDAKVIDNLLQEVRDYQMSDIKVAENNCQEFVNLMGDDGLVEIQEDFEAIDMFKNMAEEIKTMVWEDKLESNKIQNAVVEQDPTIDIKEATETLRTRIRERTEKTKQLKSEYDVFVKEQKRKYDILLRAKREEAEKLRLKKLKEEEEKKKKEVEERELARLRKLQEEAERKKREEEERLRRIAEEEQAQREKEASQKLLQQKSEIKSIINDEAKNLHRMQIEAEEVEMQQREIELIHERRMELNTKLGELGDEKIIEQMLIDFTDFSESLQNNEETLIAIGKKVQDPDQEGEQLMAETLKLCDSIKIDWERLNRMKLSTETQMALQKKQLTFQLLEIRRREEEAVDAARRALQEVDDANAEAERLRLLAEEQRRLLEDEERRRRLLEEEEAFRFADEMRRMKLLEEEERLRRMKEDEEERRRRELQDEEMRRRQQELEEMEARLANEQENIATIEAQWRNFTWDETPWDGEYAGELLGFISNPALLYGIRDPKKIAEILRRAQEMAQLRERMRQDALKLEYICKAIEEMQQAAREAEEKRWVRQNTEWIHDVVVSRPTDLICSTHEASFTAVNFLSLEESRRQAKQRKISREQMAPVTLQELAKHSSIPIDALEGNYGQWSRSRLNPPSQPASSRSRFLDRI